MKDKTETKTMHYVIITNLDSVHAGDGVAVSKGVGVPVGVGSDQGIAVLVDLVGDVPQGHGYASLKPGHSHEHHGSAGQG